MTPSPTSTSGVPKRSDIVALYNDINFPSSFSSLDYFYRSLRKRGYTGGRKGVEKLLHDNFHFQATRKLRAKFPRRNASELYFSMRWEGDLLDVGEGLAKSGVAGAPFGRYALLVADCFSHRIWLEAMDNKLGRTAASALERIRARLRPPYRLPDVWQSDAGKEFVNQTFKAYLASHEVRFLVAKGRHKARIAERMIKAVKKVLVPLLESVPRMTWAGCLSKVEVMLNARPNKGLGDVSPDQVLERWPQVQALVRRVRAAPDFRQYAELQRRLRGGASVKADGRTFRLGSKVLIPVERQWTRHRKETSRQFSYRPYTVCAIHTEQSPVMFSLADESGKRLTRLFYAQELRTAPEGGVPAVAGIRGQRAVKGRRYGLVTFRQPDGTGRGAGSTYERWLPLDEVSEKKSRQ